MIRSVLFDARDVLAPSRKEQCSSEQRRKIKMRAARIPPRFDAQRAMLLRLSLPFTMREAKPPTTVTYRMRKTR